MNECWNVCTAGMLTQDITSGRKPGLGPLLAAFLGRGGAGSGGHLEQTGQGS